MKAAAGATESGVSSAEISRGRVYRWAGIICMFAALSHTFATLVGVYTVREGNLGDFAPMKILQFVAANVVLWKTACLLTSLASISLVVLIVALREVVERRLRMLLNLATMFAAIAAPAALNGQLTMAVLFCDLALQNHFHHALVAHEVAELGWAVMNNAITQCVLIANTLNSIAGLLIVWSMLATRNIPKWLAWLGLPIWIASFNVSSLTFIGSLQWAMVLLLASTIAFVMWTTTMGLIFRMLGRQEPQGG